MSLDALALFLYQVFWEPLLAVGAFLVCLGLILALLNGLYRLFDKSQPERR